MTTPKAILLGFLMLSAAVAAPRLIGPAQAQMDYSDFAMISRGIDRIVGALHGIKACR